MWDEVTSEQNERLGPAGIGSDRSPTERQIEGDYLYIDPVTGFIVHQWAAKRRWYSMYDGDSPHTHLPLRDCAFSSGPLRTFADVNNNLGAILYDVQEHNPQRGQKCMSQGNRREPINKWLSRGRSGLRRKIRKFFNPRHAGISRRFAAG